MSGGEWVNFLQAPTSFPQAPSYFEHSKKDVEGGGPGKKDVGTPRGFPLKRVFFFYSQNLLVLRPAQGLPVRQQRTRSPVPEHQA